MVTPSHNNNILIKNHLLNYWLVDIVIELLTQKELTSTKESAKKTKNINKNKIKMTLFIFQMQLRNSNKFGKENQMKNIKLPLKSCRLAGTAPELLISKELISMKKFAKKNSKNKWKKRNICKKNIKSNCKQNTILKNLRKKKEMFRSLI